MAVDLTPWMIGGGAEHSVETARMLAYVATGGAEGVAEPGDFKVTPLPTPGGGVAIAAGGVLIRNSNPGGEKQTYVARNDATDTRDVQASGSSSGRADMVAVVVRDPQYPGTPVPDDPLNTRYVDVEVIQGVPANARTAADAGLTFPAYPIARINLPSSTGTVQQEHITDLRSVANPQTHLHMRANNLNMADAQSLHTGTSVWPLEATHTTRIPEWATHVQMHATWGTVHTHPTTENPQASGQVTIALVLPGEGTISSQQATWRTVSGSNRERFTIVASDNRPIPAEFRGREVTVELRGTKTWGANIYMDGDSSWSVQLFFEQAAV